MNEGKLAVNELKLIGSSESRVCSKKAKTERTVMQERKISGALKVPY